MEENRNLNKIGNRKPFSVPSNYFEDFASQFDAQITIKPVSSLKLLRPWMYMAAMFLGVLFLSRMVYTVYTDNKTDDAENYDLYVMTQVNDVESLDFYEAEVTEKQIQ